VYPRSDGRLAIHFALCRTDSLNGGPFTAIFGVAVLGPVL
jgi:hypothetical protein